MTTRVLCAVTAILAGACAFAQNANQTCTLAGTVVNSTTNAGIPHALVTYFGAARGFRFTDTGGNFEVDNVACQFYSLEVSKPGFIAPQKGEQAVMLLTPMFRTFQESESNQAGAAPQPATVSVTLTPESTPERIPLVPVASVLGTVLDENGEPLQGVVAQAIAVKTSLSSAEYVTARTAHTDDLGHYELESLDPGDYIVRLAGESSSTQFFQGNAPNPNNDHRGMQPVYYSNADSLAAAQVLQLAPGAAITADFRQATEPAFDIDGRLAGFVPQAWTQFQLYRDGDRVPLGRAFVNLTTGVFRMTDIPRGNYTLRVTQFQGDPQNWLATEQPVTVAAEPIRNLVVPLSPAVDIPVSVSYEAGAKDAGVLMLMLQPQHARENLRILQEGAGAARMPQLPGANAVPHTFTNVVPDKYKVTVQTGMNGYVASVKLGDIDVLHNEFSINGAAPGEIHVTVRGDGAAVEGQATFQGQPAVSAQIYLVPKDSSAEAKFGFTDPKGHFKIDGAAPTEYRISGWTQPPSAKELLSHPGESITLQANEQRTISLEALAPEQGQ